MRDKATLLYEWRQLRLELQKEFSQKQLQNIMDWFEKLDPSHGFNFDDITTWPDIWEYIMKDIIQEVVTDWLSLYFTSFSSRKR